MHAALLLGLLVGGLVYARGIHVLWSRRRCGFVVGWPHVAGCIAGLAITGIALSPGLHVLAHERFSVHMVQHELLLAVAAPLIAAARPLLVSAHALPPAARRPLAGALTFVLPAATRRPLAQLAIWFAAHSVAIWTWHIPTAYDAAATHGGVHAAQHAAFLLTGVAFWASVLRVARPPRPEPVVLLALFGMVFHGGVLGALLTVSDRPLYAAYAARDSAGAAAVLADQQLGGLLMWVPGGLVYLAAGLVLLAVVLLRPAHESAAVRPADERRLPAAVPGTPDA